MSIRVHSSHLEAFSSVRLSAYLVPVPVSGHISLTRMTFFPHTFSLTWFFPDISLIFSKIPDISLTASKYLTFLGFPDNWSSRLHIYHCNFVIIIFVLQWRQMIAMKSKALLDFNMSYLNTRLWSKQWRILQLWLNPFMLQLFLNFKVYSIH